MTEYSNENFGHVPDDYTEFLKFIEAYTPDSFKGINRNDQFIIELEEIMKENLQFFVVGDLISMNFPFTSKQSLNLIGVDPSELSLYHLFQATHPTDMQRHGRARAQLMKIADELYRAKKGRYLISTNFLTANPMGSYSNILKQAYLFYSDIPYNTVFIFLLHTNIDKFRLKEEFHYYAGIDLSYFRMPDEILLMTGPQFSRREFEIIRLIESGMSSKQIGQKLFISIHTVNTHRRNILTKTGKSNISDLIYSLQEQGII